MRARRTLIASLSALLVLGLADARSQTAGDAAAPSGQAPAEKPTGDKPAPRVIDPRIDRSLVPRPLLQVGDAWDYRRGSGPDARLVRQSVTAVNPQGISLKTDVLGSGESSVVVYDRQWGLLGSGFNDYQPALAYYSFPLYPGKRWGIDSSVSNFGAGQTGRIKGEGQAIGWEEVEVPAGRFLSIKIEVTIETADPGDAGRTLAVRETHWYSRVTLRPVKVESRTEIAGEPTRVEITELISYRIE
jgi:hypothetical protein